ncbi:MAG: AAA family ATPase [Pantanalinema sp. GBBB05]|nr:AAA family ATPase [Pantanalinema sp. GBBB05]
MSFIVVDTEGKELLREIAILDHRGILLYEAFVQEHPDNVSARFRVQPLKEILQRFATLAQNQHVICHSAEHDQKVLRTSFRHVNLPWQNIKFECTWELSRQYLPNLPSYSLEYLSRYLTLRVNGRYFNPRAAHSARYDAEFTHQLYLKIMDAQTKQRLQNQPNPFSSRVDTPFQQHPDFQPIYQAEFSLLKSVITEIRHDRNHQSRGVVVVGEPGSGKTHLMMRLAQELLQINRLLFIRQPNNPDAVLYHTYARILESFVERVPTNGFTQLENLLAHSFVKIISTTQHLKLTQKDQHILSIVQTDPLNLYRQLGSEGTATRRDYWQHIEKRVSAWWMDQYGIAGVAPQIIQGIIKFCSYSEPRRKALVSRWLAAQPLELEESALIDLPNWDEEIGREDFSLEAISVFSRLSLLDEPLIIIFDQLEGLRYNEQLLRKFGFAITELFTHVPNSLIICNLFPDRWDHFQEFFSDNRAFIDRASQHQIRLNRPSIEQIRGVLKTKLASVDTDLDTIFTTSQLNEILDASSSIRVILNRAATYYRHVVNGDPIALPASPTPPMAALPTINLDEVNRSDTADFNQRLLKLEQSFSKITQVFDVIATALSSITIEQPPAITEITTSDSPASLSDNNTSPTSLDNSKALSNLDKSNQTIFSPNHGNGLQKQFSRQDLVREYLKEQQALLHTKYSQPQIITDNDDFGKLATIAQAFQEISDFELDQLRLGRKVLPEHLVIDRGHQKYAIGFLGVGGTAFTTRIGNYNELVLNHSNTQFYLFRDLRHGEISGKVGKQHIANLNNASNGRFEWMNQSNRVTFELIYQLISDIQNQEVEFSLKRALDVLTTDYSDYWLIKVLK